MIKIIVDFSKNLAYVSRAGEILAGASFYVIDEDDDIAFLCDETIGKTLIRSIHCNRRGKGYGNLLLSAICKDADDKRINLVLVPAATPDPVKGGLQQSELIEWYERNGFRSGPDFMYRPFN